MNYSNSTECYEGWWHTVGTRLGIATYYILPPIYLVVGLFGNTALILTCLQKHDNSSPYFYQVLVAASRGLFIVCNTVLFVLAGALDGLVVLPIPDWWSECHACVWMSALTAGLINIPVAIEPILTIAMVYDRFLALKNPIVYRTPTKRQYVAVTIGSTLIGLSSGVVGFVRFYVVPGSREGTYKVAHYTGLFFLVYTQAKNAFIVLQLLVSYAFNSAVCYLYFKRNREVKHVQSTQQEMKKRAAAKDLLVVSITQGVSDGIQQLANVVFFAYYNTASGPCFFVSQSVVTEITDLISVFTTVGQFYILCAVSHRFRRDAMMLFRKPAVTATPVIPLH